MNNVGLSFLIGELIVTAFLANLALYVYIMRNYREKQ